MNTKDPHMCKGTLTQKYCMLYAKLLGIHFQQWHSQARLCACIPWVSRIGVEQPWHLGEKWYKNLPTWKSETEVRLLAVMFFVWLLAATLWSAILVFWLKSKLWSRALCIMSVNPHLQAEARGFSCSVSKQQWCVPAHALKVELCVATSKTTRKFIESALWSQFKKGKDVFKRIFFLYLEISLYEKTSDNST